MTKEKILETFKDINHMYNNPTMYDTLEHMLDDLIKPKIKDPEELDVDSCFGKLSALHFEVLKMNLQLDFIEDFNLAMSLKEKIKCMDELIESLVDDIWICESLLCVNDEED